uniref:Uncharacterized protein n=1 Tax=Trichobilharzia regenti TaxID=157069 RepID=A0AA85JK85_TRIRE
IYTNSLLLVEAAAFDIVSFNEDHVKMWLFSCEEQYYLTKECYQYMKSPMNADRTSCGYRSYQVDVSFTVCVFERELW